MPGLAILSQPSNMHLRPPPCLPQSCSPPTKGIARARQLWLETRVQVAPTGSEHELRNKAQGGGNRKTGQTRLTCSCGPCAAGLDAATTSAVHLAEGSAASSSGFVAVGFHAFAEALLTCRRPGGDNAFVSTRLCSDDATLAALCGCGSQHGEPRAILLARRVRKQNSVALREHVLAGQSH